MKILSLFLSLPLLLSPALVKASDTPIGPKIADGVKHASSALWSLRQLPEGSFDRLPQDLLNVLGQALTALEPHGIWLHESAGNRWVPVTTVLQSKEQTTEGLLRARSAKRKEILEHLVREQNLEQGAWHAGKVYGAAFIAYYLIDFCARYDTKNAAAQVASLLAMDSAREARSGVPPRSANTASDKASKAARKAASAAAWKVATYAIDGVVFNSTSEAAGDAAAKIVFNTLSDDLNNALLHFLLEQKIALKRSKPRELGVMSYDLAEIFSLLWLSEHEHEYFKTAFAAAYELFPAMQIDEINTMIIAATRSAATSNPKLKYHDNIFLAALWRDLKSREKIILAK